ncbi:DEDD exonuclease domain-containing protein [Verrucosispora sp. WMMA2044]|uniref:DEDD exonuclease domain-containing protein n=1 Tax=Verrucosispora sioxanthis TaxID=2499994 RepID=A0A6M1LAU0_9ACTN|nr:MULTISPECIES: DEDD exonuclease domain-containing protein [Micromonospora]NEE66263.1 DEDD exonuclease domain-containing protein [Verrucosispora sioxanthis]NGM15373.1 DEDD exonuclease domain-containing protein [Verrucosispora sioxanthis]WBB49887.1 DEDD exonuclease domain-containing protein [Verrucosispora sp. WMMA2044]
MAAQEFRQPPLAGLDPTVGGVDPALPLYATTFVVVDLETTGGAPDGGGITEIGAVKVRGGEELGVLATLVNPGVPIPPFITVLTGITQAMLLPAPPIEQVLPSFLEFVSDAVLVAHNAPYDVGFLKAACAKHGYRWPNPRVLDTAALARRVLLRDEVPNRKLGTLAAYFRAATQPTHRALDDARATVDVLHGLIGRLGGHRVDTIGDAIEFARAVTPTQRRKRHLADGLPRSPGVYIFRAADERPLYIGTSRDIATRVRSYFTAAEKRARISEMLAAAERVEAVECAHSLEAEVRELRLIAAHAPPYNRRSKYPERVVWLKLTDGPYPRLSVVREISPGDRAYLGPFTSRRAAELAAAGFHDAVPLRQCTHRLSLRTVTPACALAELGRCPAPCEHRISPEEYDARAVTPFATATTGDPQPVVDALLARIEALSAGQRYEEAAALRSRLAAVLRAAVRMQRLAALSGLAEVAAAHPAAGGGWELALVRHGRLAGAGVSPPGVHPRPTLTAIRATAETVPPGHGPVPAASPEESERILSWLERPETRLVEMSAGWSSPVAGAARFRDLLTKAESAASRQLWSERS